MTEDLTQRGEAIARRRLRHGIASVAEFARRVDLDRQTVTRAESGAARVQTIERLERWLDDLDDATGIDTTLAQEGESPEVVEFDITGPRTDWHVVVRGPVDKADELRRQVVELLKDIDPGS